MTDEKGDYLHEVRRDKRLDRLIDMQAEIRALRGERDALRAELRAWASGSEPIPQYLKTDVMREVCDADHA